MEWPGICDNQSVCGKVSGARIVQKALKYLYYKTEKFAMNEGMVVIGVDRIRCRYGCNPVPLVT